MKKKLYLLVLLFTLLTVVIANAYPNEQILVNNKSISSIIFSDNQVYVPLKETCQALSLEQSFSVDTLTALIRMDENELTLKLDNYFATLNGKNLYGINLSVFCRHPGKARRIFIADSS